MSYQLVITDAPEAYDYDKVTMPFDREVVNYLGNECRVVFVAVEHLRSQLDRYKSGLYLACRLEDVAPCDYRWEQRVVSSRPLRG